MGWSISALMVSSAAVILESSAPAYGATQRSPQRYWTDCCITLT